MSTTTGDDEVAAGGTAGTVRYETSEDGRVAHVTLARPQYRNAQSRVLLEDL